MAFHEIVGDRTEAEPKVYESPLLGVYVSMQNWIDAGPVLVDRLRLSNYTKEPKFDEFVKTLKWEAMSRTSAANILWSQARRTSSVRWSIPSGCFAQ